MTTADPWEKAADCERSLQAARDPQRRVVLEKLRDLWIALANQKSKITDAEMAMEAEVVKIRMHVKRARGTGAA